MARSLLWTRREASTFNIYMVDPAVISLIPTNSSGGGGALLLHTDALINGTGIVFLKPSLHSFLRRQLCSQPQEYHHHLSYR